MCGLSDDIDRATFKRLAVETDLKKGEVEPVFEQVEQGLRHWPALVEKCQIEQGLAGDITTTIEANRRLAYKQKDKL